MYPQADPETEGLDEDERKQLHFRSLSRSVSDKDGIIVAARPFRQGEARCPNCRWRAAARWKVPLTWLVRTSGAIASMMIVVLFTKGRAKPLA